MPVILARALRNLRVPIAARRLMLFYAAQATGFRPSLSQIEKVAQINQYNISKHRKQLIDRGFIFYDGKEIVIDWLRIRLFACLDIRKMGKPKSWRIDPVDPSKCYKSVKTDLHNYRERGFNSRDQLMLQQYEATAQALADGVRFPELQGTEYEKISFDPKCYEIVKTDLHNYRGTSIQFEWYNPFDDPDPDWVYQLPVLDAYGVIAGYVHYNTLLPF